jgi:ABC-type phosphate transport system substrate-binding protein
VWKSKYSGVVVAVQTTRGAVGYVAIGNAVDAKLTYAGVQNRAGAFVTPSTKTIAVVARQAADAIVVTKDKSILAGL